jgi:hypothetical protein
MIERFASSAPFLCRILCHLLWPAKLIAGIQAGHAAVRATALPRLLFPVMTVTSAHPAKRVISGTSWRARQRRARGFAIFPAVE